MKDYHHLIRRLGWLDLCFDVTIEGVIGVLGRKEDSRADMKRDGSVFFFFNLNFFDVIVVYFCNHTP